MKWRVHFHLGALDSGGGKASSFLHLEVIIRCNRPKVPSNTLLVNERDVFGAFWPFCRACGSCSCNEVALGDDDSFAFLDDEASRNRS